MNIAQAKYNAVQSCEFPVTFAENEARKVTLQWAAALQADTVSTSVWECEEAGLTVASDAIDGNKVTAVVSGGVGHYTLVNRITTSGGETLERLFRLRILDNQSYPWANDDYGRK